MKHYVITEETDVLISTAQ